MNNLLYWLNQIDPLNRLLVGDKVLSLSELQKQNYPVLPGFVISSSAWAEFLSLFDHSNSILADFPASSLHVNVDDSSVLQWVAHKSQQAILENSFPMEWHSSLEKALFELKSFALIVRLSLAIPGVNSTNLCGLFPAQVCHPTPDSLELALKKIWASIFTAKSIFYWQRIGIDLSRLKVAVLVQPLYNAIASGIIHFHGDSWQIQANWGLGHSLARGEVNHDNYLFSAVTGEIQSQKLGNKTLAYRLKPDLNINDSDILETYILPQEQQNNYCLNQEHLSKIKEIVLSFPKKIEKGTIWEWTLTTYPDKSEAKVYLLQSNLSRKLSLSTQFPQSPQLISSPLIQALSASPGIAIGHTYVIPEIAIKGEMIPKNSILVTKNLPQAGLNWLTQAKGIIIEIGGITSHAAIIARELGIPAIVGAKDATKLLQTGDLIRLDGSQGEVYLETEETEEHISKTVAVNNTKSKQFNYPLATQLMVNLSQVNSLSQAQQLPLDGIGLIRSELMLLESLSQQSLQEWLHPEQQAKFIQEWSNLIAKFAQEFAPRPIFYRSLDWLNLEDNYRGNSSLSELRGTYYYRLNPTLFDLELQALTQAYNRDLSHYNIKLILPFVRSIEEFNYCLDRIRKTGLTEHTKFQIWIMAEVPSVIFLLPKYVQAGVQGIAIGTNDLTQLLLGIDRDKDILFADFNPTHPAMLEALKQLITQAKRLNIPCSICGQAPLEYPQLIDDLIRWGITSISVELEAVEKTYRLIARAEKRLLLESKINRK